MRAWKKVRSFATPLSSTFLVLLVMSSAMLGDVSTIGTTIVAAMEPSMTNRKYSHLHAHLVLGQRDFLVFAGAASCAGAAS